MLLYMLPSCGVYRQYQSTPLSGSDTLLVDIPVWRQFFTDAKLQELIDTALVHNSTLSIASMRLRQADESMKAAKLAYIPSLAFAPNGGIGMNYTGTTVMSYGLPFKFEWNFGSPGSLYARKHQAAARRIQAQDRLNAARNEVICQLASDYYMLQMLDRKVDILNNTIEKWSANIEIQKDLMSVGKTFYNSVAQMESKIMEAKQDLLQTKADIITLERAVCLLIAQPYHSISRSTSDENSLKLLVGNEVSLAQLRQRPDVRAAERDLEISYYLTSEAKSAFYPSINLSGDFGWPMLINAAASLVQPIFAQGTLRSRLNISKLDQEIAHTQFTQILLQAATEVCQALADHRLYAQKQEMYHRQIEVQQESSRILEILQRDGTAKYLEVIKAEESLLDARVDECESIYRQQEAAIKLFKALAQ